MSTPNLVFGVIPSDYKKRGNEKAKVNVEDVAIWNEYGTEHSPPRPAFRRGMEHGIEQNRKQIAAQLQNITRRILTGRSGEIQKSVKMLLGSIGKSAKAKTKEIIKAGDETPNAPSTAARKGFNHPLFETGKLLDAVQYEVK